jgi:thymidylate kinase
MKIVSISGLDGSGKSTQIEMLKNELEKNDQKAFYFHAVNFSIANKSSGRPGNQKAITQADGLKIFLRKIALLIDIFRFKNLYQKLSKKYDYLLTDRYFYDQIVNILYLENRSSSLPVSDNLRLKRWWLRISEACIAKPDIAVYLQVQPETILQRDRKIEQGKEYLDKKKEIYDFMGRRWGLRFLDGEKEKERVFTDIKLLLEKLH